MSQTIAQMRVLARDMGISLHELIRRRAAKTQTIACYDETATVRFLPRVLCRRELPDNYRFIHKTIAK